jgi:phosphatidylinositol alpha-1,6-mannosyltransferase
VVSIQTVDAAVVSVTALVVTPNFPPATGGIEALLHGLLTRWSRIEPIVVTVEHPDSAAFDAAQSMPIVRVRAGRNPSSTAAILNAAAIRHGLRRRPDVVLSGHIVTSPAAWALSRTTRTPFVQYLYGREVARRPRLAAFAIDRARATVAISEYTEGLARAVSTGSPTLHRVPPGIAAASNVATSRNGGAEIVAIARLVERSKGLDVLLAALPLVVSQVPEARLTIVGDGPLRGELEQTAAALHMTDRVVFAGRVDDARRDQLLAGASVFALPTRLDPDGGGEGFGIVYLEAGAAGLPVVAGDAGGAGDAVIDGETGLLVDSTDASALAGAIVRILDDAELATRLGRAGAAHAATYDWDLVAPRVEDILLSVAAGK